MALRQEQGSLVTRDESRSAMPTVVGVATDSTAEAIISPTAMYEASTMQRENVMMQEDEAPRLLPEWKAPVQAGMRVSAVLKQEQEGPRLRFGHPISDSSSIFVVPLTSKVRLLWDLMSAIIIGYDLLTFPLDAFGYSSWVAVQ